MELAGTRRSQKPSDLVANLPQGMSKGRTRSWVSARVGMKGRTYSKASKAVDLIDEEIRRGNLEAARALRTVLNQ